MTQGQSGAPEERDGVESLRMALSEAIAAAGAGEMHGEAQYQPGEAVLTAFGPDAEALWEAAVPVLETLPFARGSRAIKRFGAAEDEGDEEEEVNLAWDG